MHSPPLYTKGFESPNNVNISGLVLIRPPSSFSLTIVYALLNPLAIILSGYAPTAGKDIIMKPQKFCPLRHPLSYCYF